MRFDSFLEALKKQGIFVFSLKDASRIIGKPIGYTKLFMNRVVKKGKVNRIERGKYCLPETGEYEIASNIVYPSYISFLSALAFHNLTTQIPVKIQVAYLRQKKEIEFKEIKIEFVKLHKKLFFGFKRIGNVSVADPEKAVIDGLYLPRKLPISEIYRLLDRKALDTAKLLEYAERLGSEIVKRRLGFLLEETGEKQLPLLKKKPTRYLPLNPSLPLKGKKNRRWMLIINEKIEYS